MTTYKRLALYLLITHLVVCTQAFGDDGSTKVHKIPTQVCSSSSDCAHEVKLRPCTRFCRGDECNESYVRTDCKAYNRASDPWTMAKAVTSCALAKICKEAVTVVCSSGKCTVEDDQTSGMQREILFDSATALKVGEAILETYFGADLFTKYKPYQVIENGETWAVFGSSIDGNSKGGGMPSVELRKKDASVKEIGLSQ